MTATLIFNATLKYTDFQYQQHEIFPYSYLRGIKEVISNEREGKQNDEPSGSTSRANFRASDVAKSELAGETARMRQFGLEMKDRIISCT